MMLRSRRLWLSVGYLLLGAAPAHAHPGDHGHFSWSELAGHLFEPDHLFFAALTIVVGILAFRAGRRVERRARERSKS
jgi:hypothetical protein